MSTADRVVGVAGDSGVEWHARNLGPTDHETLCGVDANDPTIGHYGAIEPGRGQKITCPSCRSIWRGVVELSLRESHFDVRE